MDQQQQMVYKALHRLGYQLQDILPVDINKIQADSLKITKNMNKVEKQFYLLRKSQALSSHRKKILIEVDQEINQLQKYSVNHKNKVNPIIIQLIKQHQTKSYQKIKYINKLRSIAHSKTQLLNQTTLSQTNTFNNHQTTQSSKSSSCSSKSQKSSKKQQKYKLIELRKKQEQINKSRKQDYNKKIKAHENRLKRREQEIYFHIRNMKIKSQLSNNKVKQNRNQIQKQEDYRRNILIQKLYQHHQTATPKTTTQKHKRSINFNQYKQIRQKKQQQFKQYTKNINQAKMNTAKIRKKSNDNKIIKSLNFHSQLRDNKIEQIKQDNLLEEKQQRQINLQMLKDYSYEHQKVMMRRKQYFGKNRLKCFQEKIKQELAEKKRKILNERRRNKTENIFKEKKQKQIEISQIIQLKNSLLKDRRSIEINSKNIKHYTLNIHDY